MPSSTDAKPASETTSVALFEFLDETHQRLQQELHHMNRIVEGLVQDDLGLPDRVQMGETVQWFDTVARQHHIDEELHVFPALLASSDDHVVHTTQRLRQDHGWIEQGWLELGPHLSAVASNNSWIEPELVQQMVQVFTQLCLDHLMLEESLAYPEARARMDPEALRHADREMANRRAAFEERQEARRPH